LKPVELLMRYCRDGWTQTLADRIRTYRSVQIRGLSGSLDAVVAAATFTTLKRSCLFILHDREEAAYFQNDLQNLLDREVLFFPMSYRRPYEFEEIENANVLMRTEVLSVTAVSHQPLVIVSYPEALSEKVIHKRALSANTFPIQKGSKLDLSFLEEFLHTYHFEKTDFVYEAGQFAVRGGIVDVFSFAHELPFRIELLGDSIESIRSFDPVSQLSVSDHSKVNIVPNLQSRLVQEERQSFLDFLPADTLIWFKDYQHTSDIIGQRFDRAVQAFEQIVRASGGAQVALQPESLFETEKSFAEKASSFHQIEFGHRFRQGDHTMFAWKSSAQPEFRKNFDLLAANLHELSLQDYQCCIAAEMPRQLDRLTQIFGEIKPGLHFTPLPFSLRQGYVDHVLKLVCYTDHQIFERFHRYHAREKFSKSKALTLRELQTLKPGDFVTHIDYGIGKFAGLEKKEINGRQQELIRLVYRDDDVLYVSIHALHKISRYTGKEGTPPVISKLGTQEWEQKKARVKKKVQDIAKDLITLYARRKSSPGYAFSPDSYLQAELESSFMYEDTPDQARATEDVKRDMEAPHPMDRLICGDVGFGKTEVAIRAAFKAATDGKQVAVLVPTTILAFQHYRTFTERLQGLSVTVDYISRFRSSSEIKAILEKVREGKLDILIGTHRIVSRDVQFRDLGLLIIDEEQKFGVKVKEKLKELKVNVDVLTLTATPIPRTLHFSLMGARDLSIIATPPPNRQPVTTELHTFNETIIRDAVSFELRRGGQVFFVHNRIQDIDEIANLVFRLVPDARIAVAHGQMQGDLLEKTMLKFIHGEYDVLVSTNIIESGLDIPNANTIIINQAHTFGLSDLHQMRGRVGRSNKKAFCYLLTPPASLLSSDARKRLAALEEFSDLGDGFKVAMRDLDIRGAGNLLGAEQSGFINDLGFETYHKILDEAIQELKETEFSDLFAGELAQKVKLIVRDCIIETDLEILIPEWYVSSISERLQLYARLDNIRDEAELSAFAHELRDRFGQLPPPVEELIESVRLRWLGEQAGFERIVLKNEKMKGYFVTNQPDYFSSAVFDRILKFVQSNPRLCRLRDQGGKAVLWIDNIKHINQGIAVLHQMLGVDVESVLGK
jgi:transcription-repair coupling factor (superfamily II helicase)